MPAPLTNEQIDNVVKQIREIIGDLNVASAELVAANVYFNIVGMTHVYQGDHNPRIMQDHIAEAWELFYEKSKDHFDSLKPKH